MTEKAMELYNNYKPIFNDLQRKSALDAARQERLAYTVKTICLISLTFCSIGQLLNMILGNKNINWTIFYCVGMLLFSTLVIYLDLSIKRILKDATVNTVIVTITSITAESKEAGMSDEEIESIMAAFGILEFYTKKYKKLQH